MDESSWPLLLVKNVFTAFFKSLNLGYYLPDIIRNLRGQHFRELNWEKSYKRMENKVAPVGLTCQLKWPIPGFVLSA